MWGGDLDVEDCDCPALPGSQDAHSGANGNMCGPGGRPLMIQIQDDLTWTMGPKIIADPDIMRPLRFQDGSDVGQHGGELSSWSV